MESTSKKIYADANGLVMFVCQDCGKAQKEQAQAYKGTRGPVKIQCKCGNAYEVEIEFRKSCRKETRLDGVYSTSTSSNWGKMIVRDLSMQGCKIETLNASLLHRDEEIKIEFRLNNSKNSLIKKRAIVRYVSNIYVGCEFKESGASFDPDLGFYLRTL